MKYLLNSLLLIVIVPLLSFTKAPGNYLTGTYGVSKNDPSCIKLTLNEDHSFTYQDFSNPAKRIAVKGNWEVKGKFVVLKSDDAENSFHNKWKISKDGTIAKSGKGVTFYTLGKCTD